MDISRAFTYIFDDSDWVGKLVITVVLTVFAFIPLFGLIAVAALLGYVVELVRNVRENNPMPLPQWENFGDKIASGGSVLVAFIAYNLPNILLGCCAYTLSTTLGGSDSTPISLVVACCLTPIIIAYNVVAWPALAIGLIRFTETGKTGEFFRFGELYDTFTRHRSGTVRWILFTFVTNLLLLLLGVIPCIGWVAGPALLVPVQGHLLGQYARELDHAPKPKVKPKGPPPRPQQPPPQQRLAPRNRRPR